MNAGAYGGDFATVLDWAEIVTRSGEQRRLPAAQLAFAYRHSALPAGAIVTRVHLRAIAGAPALIAGRMAEIKAIRETSQPVRARTGGSTFRNPDGMKAWELIDIAGCRGLTRGGAMVSEKHCNFLINTGNATAADIEGLGEEVRRRVEAATGVTLEWEIRRIGVPARRPEVVPPDPRVEPEGPQVEHEGPRAEGADPRVEGADHQLRPDGARVEPEGKREHAS
jgi:UDP-N-acetylmuramate dehydrogenase